MIAAAVLASAPTSAQAGGTTIDIQRYGDKELKIAAINKVKQLLRNELLQNPAQAGDWVKLALSDALSFNAASDSGGADASVAYDDALLQANPAFKKAVGTLKGVQKAVLKTTEVSLSDVLAYAGAEAIEASGGPRIAVQIGRYDADKVIESASPHLSWVGEGAAADVVKAFKASGFGVRECAVLVGAIGSVERASGSALGGKIKARVDPLDDENELFPADGGIFIPSTFGSQKAMFGELLSNEPFDACALRAAVGSEGYPGVVGQILVSDGPTKVAAAKLGNGKVEAYRKELVDAYIKVTVAGASLTGAKVLAP